MKLITWVDVKAYEGAWMDVSEAETYKPVEMSTLGWIIKEEEDYIVVVSTKDTEGLVGSVNAIPRQTILSITCVTVGCPMLTPELCECK